MHQPQSLVTFEPHSSKQPPEVEIQKLIRDRLIDQIIPLIRMKTVYVSVITGKSYPNIPKSDPLCKVEYRGTVTLFEEYEKKIQDLELQLAQSHDMLEDEHKIRMQYANYISSQQLGLEQ